MEARDCKSDGYGMVFDKGVKHERRPEREKDRPYRRHSRSRSPQRSDRYRERTPTARHERRDRQPRDDGEYCRKDRFEERNRRR